MNRIAIREVVPEDAHALLRAIETIDGETEFLGLPGTRPPWANDPETRIRGYLDRGTGTYILAIDDDGEIIGYLGAWTGWVERTRGVIFIPHVGIRAAYRGQGIGNRLFEAVESWARARGARRMELRVAEENARGRALYTKRGFREEGRVPDAARRGGRWCADYWMGRALADDALPRWDPIEQPRADRPRDTAPESGALDIRPLRPEEASLLQAWERSLLTGSLVHLKQASEVAGLTEIAKDLADGAAASTRFSRAALIGEPGRQRVVAYMNAWSFTGFRSEHDAHFTLNVLPASAGRGIGGQLGAALEAWAPAHGIHRLTTLVQSNNARGLRFGEARGFRREAVAPNYAVIDGRSVDRIQLGKILS